MIEALEGIPMWRINRVREMQQRVAYKHGMSLETILARTKVCEVLAARNEAIRRVWKEMGETAFTIREMGMLFNLFHRDNGAINRVLGL